MININPPKSLINIPELSTIEDTFSISISQEDREEEWLPQSKHPKLSSTKPKSKHNYLAAYKHILQKNFTPNQNFEHYNSFFLQNQTIKKKEENSTFLDLTQSPSTDYTLPDSQTLPINSKNASDLHQQLSDIKKNITHIIKQEINSNQRHIQQQQTQEAVQKIEKVFQKKIKKCAPAPTKNMPKIYINGLLKYMNSTKIRQFIVKNVQEDMNEFDEFVSILKKKQSLQNMKFCFGVKKFNKTYKISQQNYVNFSVVLRKCFYKFLREEAGSYFFHHKKIENPALVKSIMRSFEYLVKFPEQFQEIENPLKNIP